ncbi:hypothetical protein RYX36_004165 [Vicia faba]
MGKLVDGDGDRNMILGTSFFVTLSDYVAVIVANAKEAIMYFKNSFKALVLEIYNETIRDLLAPTENPGKKYNVIHDANGKNTYVPDLTIVNVCGADEISTLLQRAAQSSLIVLMFFGLMEFSF